MNSVNRRVYKENKRCSKECGVMTDKQKSEIIRMRELGASFARIAEVTGVSRNTIKSFCRRQNVTTHTQTENVSDELHGKQCGKPLHRVPGRKMPKFCSTACRTKWWNAHPEEVNRKAVYSFTCSYCKKPFTAYGNKSRKYCSHECYMAARFGKGDSDE